MKNGLCLAGGGIKGAAHIGALKAFEEENIDFQYIGGTSSGSIVACLYACGFLADEMYKIFKRYSNQIKYFEIKRILQLIFGLICNREINIDGLNSGKKIEEFTKRVCNEKGIYTIKDIKKPLIIPSVNLDNGDLICFTSVEVRNEVSDKVIFVNDADIGKVVRASCSFPVVFSPCSYKDVKLLDGGIRENVAWREVKCIGADKVLNLIFEEKKKENKEENIIDIAQKSFSLLCRELSKYEMDGSGFTLKFITNKVGLLDAGKVDELYELGYKETKRNMDKIKKYLKIKTH